VARWMACDSTNVMWKAARACDAMYTCKSKEKYLNLIILL
jgi:hypothetical protein